MKGLMIAYSRCVVFIASLQIHGSYDKLKILLTKPVHFLMCTEEKKSGFCDIILIYIHL